jgi:TolB protein
MTSGPTLARRSLLAGSAALAVAAALPAPLRAQLRVDVSRGRVEPMPIAISPFFGETPQLRELGQSMASLVAADLDSSGLFETIDRAAYIQPPEELRDQPRFADWRQISAQALVTGVLRNNGAGVTLDYRLWDVFAGHQLTGVRFEGPQDLWRRLAHKTADSIYARLTGGEGYFDTQIAYVSETGGGPQPIKRLAVMDQDGANHRFLTDGRHLVLTPRFSPDARSLAYVAYRSITPSVFIRDLVTGRETSIEGLPGMVFSPRFAPDGRTLLVTSAHEGNSDLFAVDLATRRSTRLTSGPAIETSPSYAPDGGRIVFNSDRAGGPQLYVMPARGGGGERISYEDGRYGDPAWSPRGDLIAFTKIRGGRFHIGVINPDGSNERLLTRSYLDESPSWAPNGRVIAFSRLQPERGRSSLFSIDATGYNEREIATPLSATAPSWSPLLP